MFAVPGWSVSADSLAAEKAAPAKASADAKSRKRKRAGGSADVSASNVADLYESVVEGRKKAPQKKASKRSDGGAKRERKPAGAEAKATKSERQHAGKKGRAGPDEAATEGTDAKPKPEEHGDDDGRRRRRRRPQQDVATADDGGQQPKRAPAPKASGTAMPPPPPPPAAAAKLTPLQASMREKLVSARFRHLNETLYTRPSAEALQLFDESPEMFGEYHEGFRRQVKVWPENPVDSFLDDIRARARARPAGGKGGPGAPRLQQQQPLPRTAGTCTIADLGCGDARLAEALQADQARLRLDVRSYDLQSAGPLVTRADMAALPLADGAVNLAIFCLALMGTNWLDFVDEAYRVLHWKGELWVAEIKSRFGPARAAPAVVEHSVGNRRRAAAAAPAKQKKKKKGDGDGDGDDDAALAVEVDGADDRRRQTDVSAFVAALRRRGFVLQAEPDLSNKMFVKLRFAKAAAPTRGKAAAAKPRDAPKPKWPSGDDDDDDDADEGAILKPCVYKIR